MQIKKQKIAVIFGGKSAEHDVSIITAHAPIINSLITLNEYEIVPIYISKGGVWYSQKEMLDIEFFKTGNYEQNLKKEDILSLGINGEFKIFKNRKILGISLTEEIKIDIVFPAMHGTYGEDGSLMGVLRMANVPFVGCDIYSSVVSMDKVLTKQILTSEGVSVTKYLWFTRNEFIQNKNIILDKAKNLNYPLFVKPVHLGSSIGISKVGKLEELENAIEVALFYDEKVLIEEGVQNLIEVTLPVMGNQNLEFGHIEKPLNKTDFFDFQDKYIKGQGKKGTGKNTENGSQGYSEIPANIGEYFSKKVLQDGEKTYKALGCNGISRIDFLINEKTKEVFVNEVNTLPGSLYAHNFKKKGITNVELIKKLIDFAKERFSETQKTQNVFNSSILSR